jgi:hypothetical protein
MRAFVLGILYVTLAACAAPTAAPRLSRTTLHVPVGPQRALVELKADAIARGWRVVDEGIDTLVVDFGVATARVPVPHDDGSVAMRDTEVHATALFKFDATRPGADVTMWNNPIYWHPDYRVWLPAPDDLAPGDVLLGALCGDPPSAAAPRAAGRESSAR